MKTTEFTIDELKNIRRMFNNRELYELRDKSENQQFEEGDLCILCYTIVATFISKTQHNGYTEYKFRELNGCEFNICDYEFGSGLYHLEIPRNLYETEWKKFNKNKETKMFQMENGHSSQTMTITVKEYEDILSKLNDLASRVECMEDRMSYTNTESELKCRPFEGKDECWNEMHKQPDFGWVKYDDSICAIQSVSDKGITITDWAETNSFFFDECLENLTFTNGEPFGMTE